MKFIFDAVSRFLPNSLFQVLFSIIIYSFSYLPMVLALLAGGINLQGEYAVIKYDFDLLVGVLSLGIPQSIFGLTRRIERLTLLRYQLILSSSIVLILILVSLIRGTETSYLLVVFSSFVYTHLFVRRIFLLNEGHVIKFQLINVLFPISLGILIYLITPMNNFFLAVIFVISSLFQCCLTWSMLKKDVVKYNYAGIKNDFRVKENFKIFVSSSTFSFIQQTIQLLFPFSVCYVFTSNHASNEILGVFSLSYTMATIIYAPATIFGANIVSGLYKTNGVINKKYILLSFLGSLCVGSVIFLVAYFSRKIELLGRPNDEYLYLVSIFPLLGVFRLMIPIIIWKGDNNILLYFEITRYFVGVPLLTLFCEKTLFSFLQGITSLEILFSVFCLLYFYNYQKKHVYKT